MSFRNWWQTKSGKSKTITVLCAVLILDVGLCFATPAAVDRLNTALHRIRSDPFEGIGYMIIQAIFCVILAVIIFGLGLFWPSHSNSVGRDKEKP
jgi:hypothetical protein